MKLAQQKFITIGTGGVTGVYYAAGGAICRLVNKDRAKHGIRCSVESTGGSVFNINTIKAGELDLGFAQSDVHYNATKGASAVREGRRLRRPARGVLGAPRALHRGARKEAGGKLRRLQGQALQRRQPRFSGTRASMEETAERDGLEAGRLLARLRAQGRRARRRTVRQQDRRLLLRRGPPQRQHPGPDHDLRRQAGAADRPGGRQAGADKPVLRQGQRSRAACTPATRTRHLPTACWPPSSPVAKVPADTVYEVVKAVFENFDEFKKLHPALAHLDPKDMVKNGNSAPLHPGAVKYYKEKGWL
jgi:TRAP-type uncharacterized transport system substrate-binding protein